MKQNIRIRLREGISILTESISNFPEPIKKTLGEYSRYLPKFDWNEKMDEFSGRGDEFHKWIDEFEYNGLIQNIDTVIQKVTEDLVTLKRKEIAKAKLDVFEELIIPALGNEVLSKPLSKYEEMVLMNPEATMADIEKGFREAKNIIDADGSLNQLKIQTSDIFVGGDINIPAFERFVEKNPEYQRVYHDWKKLDDEHNKYWFKDLNAFRDTTPMADIRNLRNFLIDFRKKVK
jgi:hypothetical protein